MLCHRNLKRKVSVTLIICFYMPKAVSMSLSQTVDTTVQRILIHFPFTIIPVLLIVYFVCASLNNLFPLFYDNIFSFCLRFIQHEYLSSCGCKNRKLYVAVSLFPCGPLSIASVISGFWEGTAVLLHVCVVVQPTWASRCSSKTIPFF